MTEHPRHFIREWRSHANLTQGQVAEAIGYERSYYSRIENGKRGYDQEILERLANLYRCSPAEIIAREPSGTALLWEVVRRLSAKDLLRVTEIAKTLQEVAEPSGAPA